MIDEDRLLEAARHLYEQSQSNGWIPMDRPFRELSPQHQEVFLEVAEGVLLTYLTGEPSRLVPISRT